MGKQRVENLSILKVLVGINRGYSNHPMVKAWKDHEWTLFKYQMVICSEWINRGYKDTCKDKTIELMNDWKIDEIKYPDWLTDEFCSRHRAALLMKNYEWYSQFGWSEIPEINYIYPAK